MVILDHASGTNEEPDEELRTQLEQINGNTQLSEHYLQLARDLDVMEVSLLWGTASPLHSLGCD